MNQSLMNRLLVTFLGILTCYCLSAQEAKTLKVKYAETMYFEHRSDMPPQMAANMPKSRTNNKILYATDDQSIYIVNKEDKVETVEEPGRGGWRRKPGIDPIVFCNYADQLMSTYTDLFGKEFLIEEEKTFAWKINAGEQRDVLGYTCIKATYQRDSTTITAWYTPKIQHSVGPAGYNGLPGLILAISEGENKVILATAVEENVTPLTPIALPQKGEKVSREKFEEIRTAKMKEMREMYGNQRGMGRG